MICGQLTQSQDRGRLREMCNQDDLVPTNDLWPFLLPGPDSAGGKGPGPGLGSDQTLKTSGIKEDASAPTEELRRSSSNGAAKHLLSNTHNSIRQMLNRAGRAMKSSLAALLTNPHAQLSSVQSELRRKGVAMQTIQQLAGCMQRCIGHLGSDSSGGGESPLPPFQTTIHLPPFLCST